MGAKVSMDVRKDGATLQFLIDGDQQAVNTGEAQGVKTSLVRRLIMAGKLDGSGL
jgi:hypothetical protein